MLGTSRLAHLGVSGPFSSLGPSSNHGKLIELTFFFLVCMHCLASASFSTQKLTNDKYDCVYCSYTEKKTNHACCFR